MTPRLRILVLCIAGALAAPSTALAQDAPPGFTDGARTAGDRLVTGTGNGGYDVGAYRVALRTGAKARSIRGTAEIDATATQDLRSFSLDLERLRVRAVRLDGAPAAFERTTRKVVVTPPGGLAAGRAFTVAVDYGGTPGKAWIRTRDGATVGAEPTGSDGWFPCNDRPDDKATFDLTVDVPRGIQAIGNGALASTTTQGDRTTWRWVEDRPVQPYLDVVTIGRYRILRGDAGGLPLLSAVDRRVRGSRLRAAKRILGDAGGTVRRLEALFGPYPFASAGGTYVDLRPPAGALETSSRPTYYGLLTPEVQAHELAHQWFGNAVTLRSWSDIWLHEGFATWAGWFDTHAQGDGDSPARLLRQLRKVPARNSLWRPVIPRRQQDLFGDSVYTRGAMTVQALHERIGEAAFRTVLRSWIDEHRYGTATTADFEALAERVSGQDLDAFFDAWLRTRGKPR